MDPDRWLSSRFIADPELRADVVALYAFDHELARAPQVASNPHLAEIRLTWWVEVLDHIYADRPVRRHEVADALAAAVPRRGLPRALLEATVEARLQTLGGDRLEGEIEAAGPLTAAAAGALDPKADNAAAALIGRAWRAAHAGRLGEDGRRASKQAARRLSAAAFPAVAHAVLPPSSSSALRRRLLLIWAVARGRI